MNSATWDYGAVASRLKKMLEFVPGKTIDAKAQSLDCSAPSMYSYLSGKKKFSLEFMVKLQEITDIDLNWLLTGEGEQFCIQDNCKSGVIDIEFLDAIRIKIEKFTHEKDHRFAQIPFYEWSGPLAFQVYNILIQHYTLETLDTGFETIKPMLNYAIEHFIIFVEGVMENETLHRMTKPEVKEFIETAVSGGAGGVILHKKNLLAKDGKIDGEEEKGKK